MHLLRRNGSLFRAISLFALLLTVPFAVNPALAQRSPSDNLSTASRAENQPLPLQFIENVGQFAPGARFQVRTRDATIYLADDAIWISMWDHPEASPQAQQPTLGKGSLASNGKLQSPPRRGVNLKLSFPGANSHPRLEPFNRLATHASYFQGNDPGQWHTNVPVYGGVRFKDLYPGFDLEISSTNGTWSWRLVTNAGDAATTPPLDLRIEGADQLSADSQQVTAITSIGSTTIPLIDTSATTSTDGPRVGGTVVTSPFRETTQGGTVNRIASPSGTSLVYSTLVGGTGYDNSLGIAVDGSMNVYLTGSTASSDFPTTPGAFQTICGNTCQGFDAFVTKLNPDGNALVYSTFIGGLADDGGSGIVVDSSGNVYVTGTTQSTNFPTTSGALQTTFGGSSDSFVTKLNPTGTALLYSTYLGGSDIDHSSAIIVNGNGNAYVTGDTSSTDFPVTAEAAQTRYDGTQDAFISELTPDGKALVYSTYLGGSGPDSGVSIAIDDSSSIYVSGNTYSEDFPTTPGALERTCNGCSSPFVGPSGFVAKLNPSGTSLTYSTYLAGKAEGWPDGIAVDQDGNAYMTGPTSSTNCPNTLGTSSPSIVLGMSDTFILKLNPSGSALIYYACLADGEGYGVTIDSSRDVWVTGQAISSNFPVTSDALQTKYGGNYDAFVSELNPTGTGILYSSFLGGQDLDIGNSIASDQNGNVYVTGSTDSVDFPTTPGAYQTSPARDRDGFVTKFGASARQYHIYLPLVTR